MTTKAPGLKWIRNKPVWVAPRKDVLNGFPVKTVSLNTWAENEAQVLKRRARPCLVEDEE